VITTIFLLDEEGKFIESLSVLLNEWKGLLYFTPEPAPRSDILYLFAKGNCIFIREKSGRSQGILIIDAFGNHDCYMYLWDLPSSDDLHHEFLRHRLKVLAHDDVVVVCFTDNETKTEILEETDTKKESLLSPWRQERYSWKKPLQVTSVCFGQVAQKIQRYSFINADQAGIRPGSNALTNHDPLATKARISQREVDHGDSREVKHDVNGRRQTAKITSDFEFFSSNLFF